MSQSVDGAPHAAPTAIEHVRIDHGCVDIGVTEQLLNSANVVAAFEQMCREGVPQGVAVARLVNPLCLTAAVISR